jgi:sugar/nucleoside kinase (ribokinase family)
LKAARPQVICAGRLYADLVFTGLARFPSPGTETFCDGLGLHPGGGAVITAGYLVAGGVTADLMATLPAAPFDAVLLPQIAACGIGTGFCAAAPPGVDPQITVAMAYDADRSFLTHRAGAALPGQALELLAKSGAGHLHIGELATLAEHPDLITVARRAQMTISLDCSWDEAHFTGDIGALIAAVDVFLPNAAEAVALRARGIPMLAKTTVIKRGAAGAELLGEKEHLTVAALPATVVDATGAGDAFDGGFLAASMGRS